MALPVSVAAGDKSIMFVVGTVAVVALILYWQTRKDVKAVASAASSLVTTPAKAVADAISDRENIAYAGVNSIGKRITGEQDWSLGGALYDLTHPVVAQAQNKLPKPK